jgi:hypothetical protein
MGDFAYGNAKGQSFEQGSTDDLTWYLKTQKERVAKEPGGKYARFQQKDIAEIEGILRQRSQGGGTAMVPAAGSGATQIVQRQPTEARALEGTYSEARKVKSALEHAADCGHLVTPATGCSDLPEGCSIALSVVYISAGSETYDVGAGKRGLSKTALQRISAAAAISWDATQSGRLDNGADARYCLWKAVGTYRSFDGREIQLVATKEMDLRDGSAQVEALFERYQAALKKWEKTKEGYAPKDPTAQIREMRLHIAAHAETKAQLRAVRSIGIRSAYTAAELQRPFIVAALQFTGRSDNPALAEKFAVMRATAMLGGARALYGVAPTGSGIAAPAQLAEPPPLRRDLDDDDLVPDSAPQQPPEAAAPPREAAPAEGASQQTPPSDPGTRAAPPPRAPRAARQKARTGATLADPWGTPPPDASDAWEPGEPPPGM